MIMWPHIGLSGDFDLCEKNIVSYLNRNFMIIDSILQMKVISFTESLPLNPEKGDIYIIEHNSYQYSGGDSAIAIFDGEKWVYVNPKPGFLGYVESNGEFFYYNGSDWVLLPKTIGDVSGPNSSLHNSIARFDGITGKWITDSGVTIDDDDVISGAYSIYADSVISSAMYADKIYILNSENNTSSPTISAPSSVLTTFTGALSEISSIGKPANLDFASIYIFENRTGSRIKIKNNSDIKTGTGKDLDLKNESSIFVAYSKKSDQWIVVGGSGEGGSGIISVADITARNAIDAGDRIQGMTVTVLDDGGGVQRDYWLVGGITNSDWQIKTRDKFGILELEGTTITTTITSSQLIADKTIVEVDVQVVATFFHISDEPDRDLEIVVRSASTSVGRLALGSAFVDSGSSAYNSSTGLEPFDALSLIYIKSKNSWYYAGRNF